MLPFFSTDGVVSAPVAGLITGALATLTAGGCAYAGMSPTSQIFGRCLVAPRNPRQIALTYDDGPNDPYTQQLLDLLAGHSIHATFFLLGGFARQRPDLVRAIAAAGHQIGNHSMTHPVLLLHSPRRVRKELQDCNAALEDALGRRVRWFRPPHGARRPDVLRTAGELGLVPVLWNAMGFDWRQTTPQAVEEHVWRGWARNQRRGRASNVLLHDGGQTGMGQDRSHTIAATQSLITRWKRNFADRGEQCEFVTPAAWV
jgi:peptidoglycan/xylan/chitin deacetylase (PgdA/CDA1 family)